VGMDSIGLTVVGGYYVAVGAGPRLIAVSLTDDLRILEKGLESDRFHELTNELRTHISNYSSRIMVPTGRVSMEGYTVGHGVWKFNQYWNIVPGREAEYTRIVAEEYLPAMEELGLKVVGGWRVIVGAGPYVISESSAASMVGIARAVDSDGYRKAMRTLKKNLITDYQSRILAPTGRIEIPFFMQEMMKGF